MISSGNFKFITSNTKVDNVLTASETLNKRLAAVIERRTELGLKNVIPTLADIEFTHVMFFHSIFKPFVQMALQYVKVPITGSNCFGYENITIPLPEVGQYYKDAVLHLRLDNDEYDNDGCLIGTKILDYSYNLENSNKPQYRFCSYPGERIIKNVRLDIGGSIIDKYDPVEMNVNRLLFLDKNKKYIYNNIIGHENKLNAWVKPYDISGNVVKTTDVSGNDIINPSFNYIEKVNLYGGYQTPKFIHEPLDLWIPFQFWWNINKNMPLPVNSTVKGCRNITFDLATLNEIIGIVPRGIYKTETVDPVTGLVTDTSNYDHTDLENVGATINEPNITMEAYINCIVIQPEIADIYIKRVGFHLIRVYKKESIKLKGDIQKQLCTFKHPIECFYVGAKRNEYFSTDNTVSNISKNVDKWHKFTDITTCSYEDRCNVTDCYINLGEFTSIDNATGNVDISSNVDFSGNLSPYDTVRLVPYYDENSGINVPVIDVSYNPDALTVPTGLSDQSGNLYKVVQKGREIYFEKENTVIDTLELKSYGFCVLEEKKSPFLNSYIPFQFDTFETGLLKDKGIHIINFSYEPGNFNPSGHLNVSRSREFYLNVVTDGLDGQTENHTLFIMGRAINFLMMDLKSINIRIS